MLFFPISSVNSSPEEEREPPYLYAAALSLSGRVVLCSLEVNEMIVD